MANTSLSLPETFFSSTPRASSGVTSVLATFLLLSGGIAWAYSTSRQKSPSFPIINPPKGWMSFFTQDNIKYYLENGWEVQRRGAIEYKNEPYNVITTDGVVTVLPPKFAQQIRNEPNLSFLAVATTNMQSHIKGFDAYAVDTIQGELMLSVTQKRLSKYLAQICKPIAEEASVAVNLSLGHSTDWTLVHPHPYMIDLIARMSSRVFLGPELCRDKAWLDVTKSFVLDSFQASDKLRQYPAWFRRFAAMCLVPQARLVQKQAIEAEKLVRAVIEERRTQREQNGRTGKGEENSVDWFEEEAAGRKYNAGKTQLLLSAVAIQTTTDLLTEVILQLAKRPDFVQELREEVASVLRSVGAWSKSALFNLKLLDSAIKEAQRMRPVHFGAMPRIAMADVVIPGIGVTVPKGARLAVSSLLHYDPSVYKNPFEYDIHRFADMRDDDSNGPSHLVSTGPASLGFGHGNHSCPGRFFAANELKIALCYLLINYDWEIDTDRENYDISPENIGFTARVNQTARVRFKKRAAEVMEVDLDAIQ